MENISGKYFHAYFLKTKHYEGYKRWGIVVYNKFSKKARSETDKKNLES
jgi:hypothetical protein